MSNRTDSQPANFHTPLADEELRILENWIGNLDEWDDISCFGDDWVRIVTGD